MNLIKYFNTMSDKRAIGLLCQIVIVLVSIYAGTLYPPDWVSQKTVQDYIPSVLPFAVIVTLVISLVFTRETKVMYSDEMILNDYIDDEEEQQKE